MTYRRFLPTELATLAAILLLAAVFRYWQIAEYPKALHYDEVINGLVVQDLLRGKLPGLLTYDRAREPIIFYIMAVPVALFGPTPGALRVAAATISLGVVGAVFMLARELFGQKIGLLTALICATTVWPIYHGRLATRSILVPLVMSLALYTGVRAWRTRRKLYWTFAGLLFGAVFYTYASNFFIIPTVILTAAGLFMFDRKAFLERKWEMLWATVLFVGVGVPIFVFRFTHPATGPGRPGILSMFYPGQSASDFVKTVFIQSVLVGRMFFIKGDLVIRHNIPARPVFDVLMAAPFVIGLIVAWQRRTRRVAALCALWLCIWLLPTFLAKDAPHFLRGAGVLTTVFVWPALGLNWLRDAVKQRAGKWVALLIASAVVGGSILITTRDYIFSGFLETPQITSAYFGENIVSILEFNQRHRTGWVGDNLRALPKPAEPLPPEELERARNFPQPYAQYLIPWLFDPSLVQY
ncbi:MAG TPA: glycosyltransferase family 39 protein [Anaerolineales bacterium]|nr:glycosyltransferase family 39 protein [Anaerolineales bacterium]